MPKWLLLALAVAVVAGLVWLEQNWTPQMERVSEPEVVTAPAPEPVPPPSPASEDDPSARIAVPTAPETVPGAEASRTGEAPAGEGIGEPTSMAADRLLAQADERLMLMSPESISYLGLAESFGMRNDRLDSMSYEAETEAWGVLEETARDLAELDLAGESEETRLHVAIYRAWLDDALAGRPFADHGFVISSHMDSYPSYLEWFMTSLHVLATPADAEDYLARLSEIPARFEEVADRLARSAAIGSLAPKFMLDAAIDQLLAVGRCTAEETSYYTALAFALDAMDGLEETRKGVWLAMAREILTEAVLPAYLRLAETVAEVAVEAPQEGGAWRAENGDAYYAYCLASQTTTDLTAAEIYAYGLEEVERIEAEIRDAATALGIEATGSIPEIFGEVEAVTGSSLGEETLDRSRTLLERIVPTVAPAFLRMPAGEIEVVDGGSYTYFSAGTADGSRPGQYFAPTETPQPIYELPTVTYHEGIPGHGFAAAYTAGAEIPEYLAGISFTAYAEGWALYAERLAWELGAYEDDPYGNLGRLQDELFRAARLVVDPGLHAQGWTVDQAVTYLGEHTGFSEEYVRSEVERYLVTPAQAVTYKIGMREFLALRERAETALGESFDLPRFHDAVLRHGEVPLSILEELVDAYIAEAKGLDGPSGEVGP
ncbi:MAG: DUF885 domain-containing protein [Candidatus Bipolaricaulota bacterium]